MARPVFLLIAMAACASRPVETNRPPKNFAQPPRPGTRFARIEEAIRKRHGPQKSGFLPLPDNGEALAWRLALVDHAEQSLDLRCDSWENDDPGALFMERVLLAADRGVEVRLLVDDLRVMGRSRKLAALDGHRFVEVRLFNPWGLSGGPDEYSVSDRLRFRMRNRLLVADNRICIVGGRDISSDSFGLAKKFNFLDLDLLACGPAVRQASAAFDSSWNSPLVAAAPTRKKPSPKPLDRHRRALRKRIAKSKRLAGHARDPQDWSDRIDPLREDLVAGVGMRVPSARKLERLLGEAREEALAVLAYFVPDEEAIDSIRNAVDRGIRVRILTNSLGSNDSPATTGGGGPWRRSLIEAGAELYELRHDAKAGASAAALARRGKFVGLHVQAVLLDSRQLYLGPLHSMPRGLENGILVRDCRELARLVRGELLPLFTPQNAWRTRLDKSGRLVWESSRGRVTRPPVRGLGQRLASWVYRLLPKESRG